VAPQFFALTKHWAGFGFSFRDSQVILGRHTFEVSTNMSRDQGILSAVIVLLSGVYAAAQQPIPLFDGTSLQGWVRMDGKPVEEDWEVVDGTLHLKERPGGGANLFTEQEYTDFDLKFEWRIAPKGNNGLKYRVRKYGNQYLGCEYQILDDAAYKLKPRGMTGSLYEVYEPNAAKRLKPVGEFNQSRIVIRGNHIEHWLNGARIVSANVGTREWYGRVAESKFSNVEGFGENRSGLIMLTAHGSEVWYRNVVLTPLPPPTPKVAHASTPARHRILPWRSPGRCGGRPCAQSRAARR